VGGAPRDSPLTTQPLVLEDFRLFLTSQVSASPFVANISGGATPKDSGACEEVDGTTNPTRCGKAPTEPAANEGHRG
jgi:hypothetical protein